MTKKVTADRMKRARDELCAVLGYGDDPEALTVDQNMRVDLVLAMKVALDDMRAALFRGEAIDHGKMMSLAESIERYLPAASKPDPIPGIYKQDPRKVMEGILDRWLAADEQERAEQGLSPRIHDEAALQRRVDDLERELVRLRGAQPHALPAPALEADESDDVIDPPIGDIVPPREQSDNPRNMRPPSGADPKPPVTIDADGKPLRPGSQLVNGKVVPIPPQARSGAETKAQADRVNADRGTVHRIMTAPSRVTGEPAPSSPITTFGVIWPAR